MEFRSFKIEDMTPDLWEAYRALRKADVHKASPFFAPHLAWLMLQVRDDTRIEIAFENDDPVGFWPLHRRPGGWSRPLGGPFSDWHAPVLGRETDLTEQAFLRGAGLSGMTVFGFKPRTVGADRNGLDRQACHIAEITNGSEDFLATQKKHFPKHFKNIRRLFRKLEREYSAAEFTMDDRSDEARAWVLDRKRRQFQETKKHNVLASDWAQKFLDMAWQEPGDEFRLNLSTLRADGAIIAAELNMCSEHVLHGWLVCYDSEFSTFAPGHLILQKIIENLDTLNLTTYDLGVGHSEYKKYYSNASLPMDLGVLDTGFKSHSPQRLLGKSWRSVEASAPDRVGDIMGKVRRRADQIVTSETELSKQVSGVVQALTSQFRD